MLHQVLVKRVGDLQPTDKCGGSHVIVAVIHQAHLVLKVTDVMFEALSGFHLDREEVIAFLLQLSSGSVLVI